MQEDEKPEPTLEALDVLTPGALPCLATILDFVLSDYRYGL